MDHEGGVSPGAPFESPPPPLPPQTALEERLPLYSPLQVRIASFLGGPFAAVYTLYQNFKQLGDSPGMKRTIQSGIAFCVGLLAILPLLPKRFPNQLIPLAYTVVAGEIAKAKHLSRDQIAKSDLYRTHTAWKVAKVCVVCFLAFFSIVVPFMLVLDATGLIHIE